MHSLIPTPALESLLNSVEHPELDKAVAELHALRAAAQHLSAHFYAAAHQNEATRSALVSLLRLHEASAHLRGRLPE